MNNATFQWFERMPEVFESHKEIANKKQSEYEDALKMRRERFKEELAVHAKTLEEFQSLGDLNEVSKYLKRASTLQQKLEEAQERVSWKSDQHFGKFAGTKFSESQQKGYNILKLFS